MYSIVSCDDDETKVVAEDIEVGESCLFSKVDKMDFRVVLHSGIDERLGNTLCGLHCHVFGEDRNGCCDKQGQQKEESFCHIKSISFVLKIDGVDHCCILLVALTIGLFSFDDAL